MDQNSAELLNESSNSITQVKTKRNNIEQKIANESVWLGNPELSEFITDMVNQLKTKHIHEIQQVNIQASLQDLRNLILERYPKEGAEVFEYIITQAFTEHAEEILALITKLDIYQAWHMENLIGLNEMNVLERDGALWEKRYKVFSNLADELWEKETDQKEYKQQVVQQTLKSLNSAKDMALNERLYILQNTIEEQYADTPQSLLINKGLMANMYFRLDSVQKDLSQMSDLQRQQTLADSRRQLGYSEENITKLTKQDKKREKRWKNGYEYMQERDQLAIHYQGDDLQHKLRDLRTEFFSHEAATIEAEEKSGFMRYERPRVYGSN
ncbi:MAG: hypothetical protein V7785_00190 [Bermanella sp.]